MYQQGNSCQLIAALSAYGDNRLTCAASVYADTLRLCLIEPADIEMLPDAEGGDKGADIFCFHFSTPVLRAMRQ